MKTCWQALFMQPQLMNVIGREVLVANDADQ